MLVDIPRDELAIITSHYYRIRDEAYAAIERAKEWEKSSDKDQISSWSFLGGDTPHEEIANAEKIISVCNDRLNYYRKIF